jgi:nucleotide-binding universal stress UspA family protein
MYPWRRILIPTDFSTASEWAFDDAIHIAGSTAAELIILHVRMTERSHPDALRFPAADAVYEYAERFELDKLRDRARRANATVQTRLVVKKAPASGSQICTTAREEGVDLIVIATHARHHVAHLLIGSTTISVLEDPPAPVLAIRYGIAKRRAMKRIVVPVHTKQTSEAAATLAASVAKRENGEVHLLSVCPDADRTANITRVAAVAGRMNGVNTKQAIVRGDDVEAGLAKYVKETNADVVFVNAQKEIGSVKRDIIRRISVPVMIVPPTLTGG